MTDTTPLEKLVIGHEGIKLKPYFDSKGISSLGIGRNMRDKGLSIEEAYFMMRNDIAEINHELSEFDWFNNLDNVRQDAIIDMTFNLGMPRLLQFENMIAALKIKDYKAAAKEMTSSLWANQVGRRAYDLSQMIITGEYLYEP